MAAQFSKLVGNFQLRLLRCNVGSQPQYLGNQLQSDKTLLFNAIFRILGKKAPAVGLKSVAGAKSQGVNL